MTPGTIVGHATVVRSVGMTDYGKPRVELRCDCGHLFRRTIAALKLHEDDPNYACPPCRASRVSPVAAPRSCSSCGGHDHNISSCSKNGRFGRICSYCSGLPHRRPSDGCPSCHRPFSPESPITVATVLAQPRADRRISP